MSREKKMLLVRALLLGLVPVICVLVSCLIDGHSFGDVNIAASEWNDELFYYKLVDGVVNYGYPLGYFGFNESHAQILSFAAWSPALVLPWIVWGLIFGWNMMSPMLCNMVVYALALFAFVLLTRASWMKTGLIASMYVLFVLNTRYILSSMPEVICFAAVMLVYGLAISYCREEKTWKLVLMMLLASVMTLMRPYLILFLLLPFAYEIKRRKWVGALIDLAVLLVTAALYVVLKKWFSAEYFTALFSTTWVTNFLDGGFKKGMIGLATILYYKGSEFKVYLLHGIYEANAAGQFYIAYLVMMGMMIWKTIAIIYRRRKAHAEEASVAEDLPLSVALHSVFSFVAMLFALLLMYKAVEGSKHLLTFIATACLLLPLVKPKWEAISATLVFGILCFWMFGLRPGFTYAYQQTYTNDVLDERLAYWESVFENELELTRDNTPNYDNSVIWNFSDFVEDAKGKEVAVNSDWQLLYMLPAGYGVSCCEQYWVETNLDTIQSRYLMTVANGRVDKLCAEEGSRWTEIGRDEGMVVYAAR